MSRFIAAAGLATASLASAGVRRGQWWAYTAVATSVFGLAEALPHTTRTTSILSATSGLIYLATSVFVIGAALGLKPLLAARDRRS